MVCTNGLYFGKVVEKKRRRNAITKLFAFQANAINFQNTFKETLNDLQNPSLSCFDCFNLN